MDLLVVDDEPIVLADIEEILQDTVPDGRIHTFTTPGKALEYVRRCPVNVAFLDIELGDGNGLELAKEIKDVRPDVYIIFVTSHDKYAVHAFSLHATGYLLKPHSRIIQNMSSWTRK